MSEVAEACTWWQVSFSRGLPQALVQLARLLECKWEPRRVKEKVGSGWEVSSDDKGWWWMLLMYQDPPWASQGAPSDCCDSVSILMAGEQSSKRKASPWQAPGNSFLRTSSLIETREIKGSSLCFRAGCPPKQFTLLNKRAPGKLMGVFPQQPRKAQISSNYSWQVNMCITYVLLCQQRFIQSKLWFFQ